MADGPGTDVRLGHGPDLQRRLHPDVHTLLLQHVGHSHAVHGGGQHTHVIGAGALDVALAILDAAPEVASADDHAHLNAHVHAFLDDVGHTGHDLEVKAEVLVAGQRFAADLQQHPLKSRFFHPVPSLLYSLLFYLIFLRLHRGKIKNLYFRYKGV